MANNPKGLGKGLAALLGDDVIDSQEEKSSLFLPISQVESCASQPRKQFDPESLADLADSIREHGIIQPLTVRKLQSGYYQIIAGERRWRAARMAGLTQVPAIVIEADETSAYVFIGNHAANGYVSATIANCKITSSTELDAVAVTIEKTPDGYTLKVNGQYIYGTDGKNTLKFTDTAANAVNTITLSETDGVIITSNTSVLRFNAASNQLRFRYYKASTYSDQQAIQLYKLEG